MKQFANNSPFFTKGWWEKALLLLFTVAVIVYFMPKEGKFNYQFDVNKPWKYGLLQASFDFPIYKNELQVLREQDSIMATYQPYFDVKKSTESRMLDLLRDDYKAELRNKMPNTDYVRHIEHVLRDIYKIGVIDGNDLQRLLKDSVESIMLVDNNTATIRYIDQLLSAREAYDYLIAFDTIHFNKDVLQACGLNNYITPNIAYNEQKSEIAKNDLLASLSYADGIVLNGQKIIDRGEIVDELTYNILESLRIEWSKRDETALAKQLTVLGQVLFTGLFIFAFILYLSLFYPSYFKDKRCLTLLFSLIIIFSIISSITIEHNLTSIYVLPFAMIPMIVGIFLESRTAFMTHLIIIFICSISLRYPHEFILLQAVAGLTAIYCLRDLSQRSQLIQAVFAIVVVSATLYFSFELIHDDDITQLNTRMYLYFITNGILLLFTYPLLFILEKTFGFTSNVTLVELSNINTNLLREMSEIAPGTFQHSLQMANLAAAAINKIGGNSQLVRTAALYHDIGKMVNPAFFTENQSGTNPHKNLSYEESAQIIISHISDGLKLAEKYNLPKVIKEFIATHHGKGMAKYFYISYKNENPDKEIDESKFSYPGPNPTTKEQAVLMMADSVEAASRSLQSYSEESIAAIVDKIIDTQVGEGYFKDCPITFKDIADVKVLFKEKLKTMYHTRISYPELKK